MSCYYLVMSLGCAALVWIAFRLFNAVHNIVYPFFVASPIEDLVAFSGAKWAVITGSTDGIGKAYASELARKGFNIVLISRSQARLDATKKEIEEAEKGVVVKTIVYDFTDANVEHYREKIANELNKLDVGVLINNVGMGYDYPEKMAEVAGGLQLLSDLVIVNTIPATLMSAIVLSQMSKRNKGIVVNISSLSSLNQMARWAAYSATKKYIDWLSAILRLEYANTGIVIQTVNSCFVATKLAKIKKTTFFTVGPDAFARSALRTVGIVSETNGCFSHQLQGEGLKLWPKFFRMLILNRITNNIHSKALKRLEREKKKAL